METGKALLNVAAGTLVLLTALACAPAAPPAAPPAAQPAGGQGAVSAQSDRLRALIESARQEGELSLSWGDGIIGGSEGISRLAEGFNRAYGLNLNVRFTPGLSFPEMAARLVQEYQAGRRASTDVYIGSDSQITSVIRADALEAVDWTAWAPNIRNPAAVGLNGEAVTFQTWLPGITYNSARLSGDAIPRSMEDLLKPQYKGRVAVTPYGASFDRLATAEMWGKQRTYDYVTRYAAQVAGLLRCNETDRIVSGEFDVFALDCHQANALAAKASGAPVDFTLASDAPIMSIVYMAVTRHAAHPSAAKLWINYIVSREAQDLLYQTDFIDSHLVEGSKTAKDIQTLEATGARFTVFDLERYQTHDEKEWGEVRQDVQRILRQQGR